MVVALGALYAAHMAQADPLAKPASAEARGHLARGNKLYGIRSFAQAVEEYKAGALVESAPVFDYNLGQCYRQLGKYQEAIWHYQRFLTRGSPEGDVLDAVNRFLAEMKAEPIGPTPARSLQGSAPIPVHTSAPAHSTSTTMTPREARHWDRVGWALTVTGVVGAGVATWLMFEAARLDDEAKDDSSLQATRIELQDRAGSWRRAGVMSGIGGGALLIVGVVKLAIPSSDPAPTRAGWNFGITGNGLVASRQF